MNHPSKEAAEKISDLCERQGCWSAKDRDAWLPDLEQIIDREMQPLRAAAESVLRMLEKGRLVPDNIPTYQAGWRDACTDLMDAKPTIALRTALAGQPVTPSREK